MKRKTIITLSILIIIVLAALLMIFGGKKQTISYQTSKINRGTITNTVTATGTIEPITKVEVGTQVSGKISKIYVDYNSTVKKGELIAELDQATLETELQSSSALMNSAKTEMDYQKINYDRISGLYKKELVSKSEYESAQYSYNKAKYSYKQSVASYKKSLANIGYAKIYSPVDGVVLSRAVDEGQTVASGFSTPTLFTIAQDLAKMQVVADVDEADIGEVKEGQLVTFSVDAFPDEVFNGTVTQVRLQATTTSNVVTYEVVINAPNPELKLKPGLTANVSITTLNRENILIAPVRALRYTPSSAQPANFKKCVWVMGSDKKPIPKEVTTGANDGINVEIMSGVKEGETIITGEEIMSAKDLKKAAKEGESNSNPFMPKRPNDGDNKRTK